MRQHDLPPRTTLFRPGETPSRIYFVAKGWVASLAVASDTTPALTLLCIRGDVVGLDCVEGSDCVDEVVTLSSTEMISVPMDAYRTLMRERASVMWFTHRELLRELCMLKYMNTVIGRYKAPDRLAQLLFILLQRMRNTFHGRLDTLSLPLTQEEIGQLLGLTNVSVNRAFRKLEADGLITTGRQSVRFTNPAALEQRVLSAHNGDLLRRIVKRD